MFMLKVRNESECAREAQMHKGRRTGVIACISPQLMTADLDDVPGRWCSHLRGCSVSRPHTHELFHNLNSEMEKNKKKITFYVKL